MTCAFQRGKLFLASLLVTGHPINESDAVGAEEDAIEKFVDQPSSDYHVRMVAM